MIRSFFTKPCYLIPLTNEEIRETSTNKKIVLYVDEKTQKLDIAIPILEKYGFGKMEKAIKAAERWYFYPSSQEEAIKVEDGRPIFKLNYKKGQDIDITSDSSYDFFTTIRNFNCTNTNSKNKIKQHNLVIH